MGEGRSAATALTRVSQREDWALFLVAAIPLVALGLYGALVRGIYHVDALARSYTAVEVVRGYEPKLANLDLAWPPVPGLLQLPIALLLPNVTAAGGAGPIVSALAAAVCVVILNRVMIGPLPARVVRYVVLLLVFGNPLTLGLAIAGITEMPALVFLLLAWAAFDRLASGAAPIVPIALLGLATGALIMSRFEAAVAAALLGGALLLFLVPRRGSAGWGYVAAMTLGYATPILYMVGVFVFLSATITGNPLYFLSGPGSNQAYTEVIVDATPRLAELVNNPFATLRYLTELAFAVAPLMVAALPLALAVAWRRRDTALAGLCALALFLPVTQFMLLITGQSAGYDRYLFTNAIFAGPLLLRVLTGARAATFRVAALTIGLLLANNLYAYSRLDDPAVRTDLRSSSGEFGYLPTLAGRHDVDDYDPQLNTEIAIATALRETLFVDDPGALVLVDNSQATRIILFSQRQRHFVSQNVIAFDDILADPLGKVDYLLVPDTLVERNRILQAYPGLFDGLQPRFTLLYQFDGRFIDAGNVFLRWGLFRIETGSLPGYLEPAP